MANTVSFTLKLQDFVTNPMKKIVGVGNSVSGAFHKVQQTINKTSDPTRKLNINLKTLRERMDRITHSRDLIDANDINKIRVYNTELNKLNKRIHKLENVNGSKIKSWAKDAFNQIPGSGLLQNPLVIAGAGLGAAVKLGSEQQQSRILFETMAGSEKAGDKLFKSLQNLAVVSPYAQNAVLKAGQTLLNFGVAQKKVIPTMNMIGDIAGGDQDRFQQLSLAFAQITSKGHLAGQELLQLVNAGFNPLQVIAQKTGVSYGELTDKMSKGEITVDMVTKAFKMATGQGGRFHNLMKKMTGTFKGQLSNFMDQFRVTLANLGEKILPILTAALKAANAVLGWLLEHGATIGYIILGIGTAFVIANAEAIGASIGFRAAQIATSLATGAMKLFNLVVKSNPVGFLIGALIALSLWFKHLWNTSEKFRATITGVFNVMKMFGRMLKDMVIGRIKELLKGIGGIGEAIYYLFTGKFSKAFQSAKQAAKDIAGIGTAQRVLKDVNAIQNGAIRKSYNAGFEKGKANFAAAHKASEAANPNTPAAQMKSGKVKAGLQLSGGQTTGQTTSSGTADRINSGGPRNITINLRSLIETLEIQAVTTQQGIRQMEDQVKEALFRILNSANAIQTQ